MAIRYDDNKILVAIDKFSKMTYDFLYWFYYSRKYKKIARKRAKILSRTSAYQNLSTTRIVTPAAGRYYDLSCIPDKVFADKILGDGVAIELHEPRIVSPVNGRIVTIAKTNHAYCIRDENGADILIHIGINTVKLEGMGFKNYVRAGQKVKKGTLLCRIDINYIKSSGFSPDTAMIVTNMKYMEKFKVYPRDKQKALTYDVIAYKYGEPKSNIYPLP